MESNYNTYTWKKIVSCKYCDGTGVVSKNELVDYHKGEYDIIYSECSRCEGQGRRLLTEYRFDITTPINGKLIRTKHMEEEYSSMKDLTVHDVYTVWK